MAFNLDDYDPVEDRLKKFWADHPDGRVLTTLVSAEAGEYIVRAELYTDKEDTRPVSSGYAQEVTTVKGVNSTSALENCETSAIGRALANRDYAAKNRASREEMEKVQRREDAPPDPLEVAKAEAYAAARSLKLTNEEMIAEWQVWDDGGHPKDVTDPAKFLAFAAHLKSTMPAAGTPGGWPRNEDKREEFAQQTKERADS